MNGLNGFCSIRVTCIFFLPHVYSSYNLSLMLFTLCFDLVYHVYVYLAVGFISCCSLEMNWCHLPLALSLIAMCIRNSQCLSWNSSSCLKNNWTWAQSWRSLESMSLYTGTQNFSLCPKDRLKTYYLQIKYSGANIFPT